MKVSWVRAALVVVFCWTGVVTAEPEPDPVPVVALRAELSGPASCHTKDYFLQEILRRTPRAALAEGGELGWTLRVFVSEQGSRFQSKLTILANEGIWMERELIAPTCDDALDALAVVVSVLVETAIEQLKQHPPESRPRPPTNGKTNTKRTVPLPYVAGGVWVPWLDDPKYFEQRGITPVATRYVRSLSASIELDRQLVRGSVLGLGLGVDISRWHPNLFNPSYSLSVGWAAGDMTRENIAIDASRLSLRAALCPVELLRRRTLGLRPCARFEGGFVYVNYRDHDEQFRPYSERYFQARTSPYLRLSWVPIPGAELRFDGGVDLEVYRPEFRPRPSFVGPRLVYQPKRQALYAALGLAIDW